MAFCSPSYDALSSPVETEPDETTPASGKRRQHTVSPFYYYCKVFVEECSTNRRRFRHVKQGFEAAALKWNTLSAEEKNQWREKYREERKRCTEGKSDRMKNKNGERGDTNSDPTDLGILKDLRLKREKDIRELKDRWLWIYSDKSGIKDERFLIISAKSEHEFSAVGFTAVAVVEFSLENGITDEYVVDFGHNAVSASANARYEATRRILNWPSKMNRELGGRAPLYFAAPGQLMAVFDALTYVDPQRADDPSWSKPRTQISLDRDLANVDDLVDALYAWFEKPKLNVSEAFGCRESGDQHCCLTAARRCVGRILDEFSFA